MFCRLSHGNFSVEFFKILSCSMCYQYLTMDDPKFVFNGRGLLAQNGSGIRQGSQLYPDIRTNTNISEVCNTLDDKACHNWKLCCSNAMDCCDGQVAMLNTSVEKGHCPRTWDGFSCFEDTDPGERVVFECPAYITHALPYGRIF